LKDGERVFTYAALFYAAGFLIHNADHIRRGFNVEPTGVIVLGTVAGVVQLLAIVLVLMRHRLAPVVAVAFGFPDAIGIAAIHLLPHWSGALSDAFPGAHATGVTGLSWFAAIAEVVGALVFGLAGLYVLRRRGGLVSVAA
jgi:hypothetical protein